MSAGRGRPLRGAIVGFGNAAVQAHLPAWQRVSGYNITAVADTAAERLGVAEQLFPQARRYTSASELLAAEKIDFLDIATPPAGHAEIITQASEHRVHVLCEKPLATTREQSAAIEQAAVQGRIAIYTVDNWKFAPLLRTIRRLLTRGEVGRVRRVDLEILRCQPPGGAAPEKKTWRLDREVAGGGIAIDHGWHAFYLLQHLTGKKPLTVRAKLERRKFLDREVEDTAEIEVEFSGASGHLFLTWAADHRANVGKVVGERGQIELLDDRIVVSVQGEEKQAYTFSRALSADSYHPEWFEPMLDDFRKEVRDPHCRGANLREAMACTELILASYRSQELGGSTVPVEEATKDDPAAGEAPSAGS